MSGARSSDPFFPIVRIAVQVMFGARTGVLMKRYLISGLALGVMVLGGTALGAPAAQGAVSSQGGLGNGLVRSITPAIRAGASHPLDSTPDRSGRMLYFTARGPHGPAVFRVPAAGGRASVVVAGAPLVRPRGIAMLPDGSALVVADPGAGTLFRVSIGGRRISPIQGSAGTVPQDLDIVRQAGRQWVYFTGLWLVKGKTFSSKRPALLLLPASGAPRPAVVYDGPVLENPDGVAVSPAGVAYVTDHGNGRILAIRHGAVSTVLSGVHLGRPAGIALSPTDTLLLVSAHQQRSVYDRVLVVDLANHHLGSITRVVGRNSAAGGLHRSPGRLDVYSWADSQAQRGPSGSASVGQVYTVTVR